MIEIVSGSSVSVLQYWLSNCCFLLFLVVSFFLYLYVLPYFQWSMYFRDFENMIGACPLDNGSFFARTCFTQSTDIVFSELPRTNMTEMLSALEVADPDNSIVVILLNGCQFCMCWLLLSVRV